MINFDVLTGENKTKQNPYWLDVIDHPCRILIIGGSGSRRT